MLPHLLCGFWRLWKLRRLLGVPSFFGRSGRYPRLCLGLPTPVLGSKQVSCGLLDSGSLNSQLQSRFRPKQKNRRFSDLDRRRLGSVWTGGHAHSHFAPSQFLLCQDPVSFLFWETLDKHRSTELNRLIRYHVLLCSHRVGRSRTSRNRCRSTSYCFFF